MTTIASDPRLLVAIDRIVRKFDPDKIVLFGSRARGDAREDSDYDLLIVLPSVDDKWRATVDVRRELFDLPMSKDIMLADRDEAADGGRPWSMTREAMGEGIVVYERG